MAILKSLFVAMIAAAGLCVSAVAGEAKAPKADEKKAPPAPAVEVALAGSQMVAEVSGPITVRYSVTNKQEKTVTLVGAKGHKTYRPLVWQVTDAKGQPVSKAAAGRAEVVPAKDDFNDSVEGRFSGEATFLPSDGKWPAEKVLVRATYAAKPETYKSEDIAAPANAFVGAVSAGPVEFAIKPDGWKEATYKRYADELATKLKSTLEPLAFEFPELRSINEMNSTESALGASGRFKLVREYLEVDDKAKTARLRRAEGFLEFAALDPWTAGRVTPDVKGTVEGGLVVLEFRTEMSTNPHLIDRLYWIESDIVKECGGTVVYMGTKKPRPEIPPIPEPPKLVKPAADAKAAEAAKKAETAKKAAEAAKKAETPKPAPAEAPQPAQPASTNMPAPIDKPSAPDVPQPPAPPEP